LYVSPHTQKPLCILNGWLECDSPQINEDAIQPYADLLEIYLRKLEEGGAKKGFVSSSSEGRMSEDEVPRLTRRAKGKGKMRITDEMDETYGDNGKEEDAQMNSQSEDEDMSRMSEDDEDDDEVIGGRRKRVNGRRKKREPSPKEPTRTSSRQQVKSRPNYSLPDDNVFLPSESGSPRSSSPRRSDTDSDIEAKTVNIKRGAEHVSVAAIRVYYTSNRSNSKSTHDSFVSANDGDDSDVDQLASGDEVDLGRDRIHKDVRVTTLSDRQHFSKSTTMHRNAPTAKAPRLMSCTRCCKNARERRERAGTTMTSMKTWWRRWDREFGMFLRLAERHRI